MILIAHLFCRPLFPLVLLLFGAAGISFNNLLGDIPPLILDLAAENRMVSAGNGVADFSTSVFPPVHTPG